jgi:hypothetical protein
VNTKVGWASFHHDNRNTGNYEEPLPIGTRDLGGGGCSLNPSGPPIGAALVLLLAALFVGARRLRRS